jgi:FAD:protein FMN transferase
MGTVFSFDVRGAGVAWTEFERVLAWLHECDGRFSTYRPDSEINRIADGRLALSNAHPDVRAVLDACASAEAETDGYFSALAAGRLDPSGYVKGWAIHTASRLLVEAGSTAHCVNGGGDVSCHGRPAAGRTWRIGIADPFHPDRTLRTVAGSGPMGVATSGGAERGGHIVDPRTGTHPTDLASVTVIARDVVHADVLATAAIAMGAAGVDWLRRQTDVSWIVVDSVQGVNCNGSWSPWTTSTGQVACSATAALTEPSSSP